MEWKNQYVNSFAKKPIEEDYFLLLVTRFINGINNRFKSEKMEEKIVLNKDSNKIIFPDCEISYEIDDEKIVLTKQKNVASENNDIIFIKWGKGVFNVTGNCVTKTNKGIYLMDETMIEDVFEMLLIDRIR